MSEIDQEELKAEIETYKSLKKNGYIESADKQFESIDRVLAKLKELDVNRYNEFSVQLSL